MRYYFGRSPKLAGDRESDAYIAVNNCGAFEDITHTTTCRENGRLDYQLIYVKKGTLYFTVQGEVLPLTPGHIYLFRPNEPQIYSVRDEETTYIWIHFAGREVENMLDFWEQSYYEIGTFPEMESFCRSFYNDYRMPGRFNELKYNGRLITLFGLLSARIGSQKETSNGKTAQIEEALRYMNACEGGKPSNDTLASLCRMSKYYFIKCFKAAVGVTPGKYCDLVMVEKSKNLLESTNLGISEIASLVGIEDALYFSRLFKKATGVSPSAYRTQKR